MKYKPQIKRRYLSHQEELVREPNLQKRKKETYELGNYKRDYLNNVIFKGFQTH